MGLFRRGSAPGPAETPGDRERREAREAVVSDLAARLPFDGARAGQVRELPGGEEMVTEAVRRAAGRRP